MRRLALAVVMATVLFGVVMLPVGAEEALFDKYPYVAKDNYGLIYLSEVPLRFFTYSPKSSTDIWSQSIGVKNSSDALGFLVLIPQEKADGMTYRIRIADGQRWTFNPLSYEFMSSPTSNTYLYGRSSYLSLSFYFEISFYYTEKSWQYIQAYTLNANYEPLLSYDGTYPTDYRIPTGNVTEDSDYSVSDALGASGITVADIYQAISDALSNSETLIAISETVNLIYTYGNDYENIDESVVNSLTTAQGQLSGAESALSEKAGALTSSVSSAWSGVKSAATAFPSVIAPAASAVGAVTTGAIAAAPEKVQSLYAVIPLLLFIGWLIGRRE